MTREEFKKTVQRYMPGVDFVERYKSTRPSHPWSSRGSGWVIIQTGEYGPLLYDSIQNPEVYQSKCPTTCAVIGRHTGEDFEFTLEDNLAAWWPVMEYLGYSNVREL